MTPTLNPPAPSYPPRKWAGPRLMALLVVSWLLAACTSATQPPTPPPLADELIFYDWEGDMPQAVLEAFTKETGVKVKYLTYESQEEAIANMRAGQVYDVVTMESRFVGLLAREKLLAEINYRHVPNFKNISANFRDLAYDPGNKHSIPYNWGFTGLVIRADRVGKAVTRWADLWDPRYAGRVGLWRGQPREVIALTLKSLGSRPTLKIRRNWPPPWISCWPLSRICVFWKIMTRPMPGQPWPAARL